MAWNKAHECCAESYGRAGEDAYDTRKLLKGKPEKEVSAPEGQGLEKEKKSRDGQVSSAQGVKEPSSEKEKEKKSKEEKVSSAKGVTAQPSEKKKAFDQVTSLHAELSASKKVRNESIRKLEEASSQVSAMEEKLAAEESREKSLNSKITSMEHDLDGLQEQRDRGHG